MEIMFFHVQQQELLGAAPGKVVIIDLNNLHNFFFFFNIFEKHFKYQYNNEMYPYQHHALFLEQDEADSKTASPWKVSVY